MSLISAAFGAFLLLQDPGARDPGADAATQLEDIEVIARRLEQQATSFVEQASSPPSGTRPARWNREICISVTGMRVDMAQYMIDRVAQTAVDAGVDVQGPGCQPNVVIFATDNGQALATELVSGSRRAFRPFVFGGRTYNRQELARFQASQAPVRWWHVNLMVEPESGMIVQNVIGDEVCMQMNGVGCIAGLDVRDMSRMRSNVRFDLAWVIIILDMSKMEGVQFGALSDYVAMVSLTQVDPYATLPDTESILNLFNQGPGGEHLSSWDRQYLSSLYSTTTNRASASSQASSVSYRLARNMAVESRAGDEVTENPE